MENHLKAKIIVVETYCLHLKMGYLMDLADTYYIFIISKNLIFYLELISYDIVLLFIMINLVYFMIQ